MFNINLNLTAILGFIAVVALGLFFVFRRKIFTETFNPTSQKNIASETVSKIVQLFPKATEDETLGTGINKVVEGVKQFFTTNPFDKKPTYFDATQEYKTCAAIKRNRGRVVSERCIRVLSEDAPLQNAVDSRLLGKPVDFT